MIPFNDLKIAFQPYLEELNKASGQAIESGWYVMGPNVSEFENQFAKFIGTEYCLGVANGTDALEIALRAIGVHSGDEVINVANAGGYTTSACLSIGAIPVYVDVDANMLISPEAVSNEINSSTKAIVVTHLYGQAVDVEAIKAVSKGIPILEDCAEAHGAVINGKKVGSLGDIATFSFYPTKNLGALGDGGAITMHDHKIAERVKLLRQYGWSSKYHSTIPYGRNSRLDEIQAAMLLIMLPYLGELNEQRKRILRSYKEAAPTYFEHMFNDERNVGHLAVACVPNRDQFREMCASKGITTDIHFPVLDSDQKSLSSVPYRMGKLIRSRSFVDRIVSLPCFPGMKTNDVSTICLVLDQWYKNQG